MGDDDTALEHHFLDVAKAQAEAEIQPDAMGDDLGGETVSPVAWRGGGVHQSIASRRAEFDNAVPEQDSNNLGQRDHVSIIPALGSLAQSRSNLIDSIFAEDSGF